MLIVPVESPYISFLAILLGCFLKKAEVFTITSLLLREYNIGSLLASLGCSQCFFPSSCYLVLDGVEESGIFWDLFRNIYIVHNLF